MSRLRAIRYFSVAAVSILATACTSRFTIARDAISEEFRKPPNPVELEESEVRYYARQFKSKCSRCHGLDGSGKGEPTPDEFAPPANFTDVTFMAKRTDGQLFHQILVGGEDRCAMPAFGPESDHAWTEDKIWHMVAFVRRFSDRRSP